MISQFEYPQFIVTKQHKRFTDFCDACRENRYIGVCTGRAGVGKTWSGLVYTRWDLIAPTCSGIPIIPPPSPEVAGCRSIFYAPEPETTPKGVKNDVSLAQRQLNLAVREAEGQDKIDVNYTASWQPINYAELLIVDEADYLTKRSLEQLRFTYDRLNCGMILVGMPSLDKFLARFPQLYSRVGLLFDFERISEDDIQDVICTMWERLCSNTPFGPITDEAAIAAIIRTTGSNFRILKRLLTELKRLLEVNELIVPVTDSMIESARNSLVIGEI